MEMGASQLALRLIGSVGQASTSTSCAPGASRPTTGKSCRARSAGLNEAPILIDETPALNAIEVRSRARRLQKQLRQARPRDRRLPAADAGVDARRESRDRDLRDLALDEVAGQGTEGAGDGALAAEPLARAAAEQAAGDVGPARERARSSRTRTSSCSSTATRSTTRKRRTRASPRSSSASSATARSAPCASRSSASTRASRISRRWRLLAAATPTSRRPRTCPPHPYGRRTSPLISRSIHSYHQNPRVEIASFINAPPGVVLDIGCGGGATGKLIKEKFPGTRVIGIEMNPHAAAYARQFLDDVICASIDDVDLAQHVGAVTIGTVLLLDVLEHLYDPWRALVRIRDLARAGHARAGERAEHPQPRQPGRTRRAANGSTAPTACWTSRTCASSRGPRCGACSRRRDTRRSTWSR